MASVSAENPKRARTFGASRVSVRVLKRSWQTWLCRQWQTGTEAEGGIIFARQPSPKSYSRLCGANRLLECFDHAQLDPLSTLALGNPTLRSRQNDRQGIHN